MFQEILAGTYFINLVKMLRQNLKSVKIKNFIYTILTHILL